MYTTITINYEEYTFPSELLTNAVSDNQLKIMSHILRGVEMAPRHIRSYFDLYTVVKLLHHFNMPMSSFDNWDQHNEWLMWTDIDYMFPIFRMNENLINFKKYFKFHLSASDLISRSVNFMKATGDPIAYIDMLTFFENYDFSVCFDENNETIQSYIKGLNRSRDQSWIHFLVDPYSKIMESYFKYQSMAAETWSAEGISIYPRPAEGAPLMLPQDEAYRHFNEFSLGLLIKPMNPNINTPFPSKDTIVAGGSILRMLDINYCAESAYNSDVDIFIFAATNADQVRIVEELINWFHSIDDYGPTTYYAVNNSVISVYIRDIARKFQIISINRTNPYEVLRRFDLTHAQWCMYEGKFYGTPAACRAMRTKITIECQTARLRVIRCFKAMRFGYSVMKGHEIKAKIGIELDDLLTQPNAEKIERKLIELSSCFYPISLNLSPTNTRLHNICMIEKDSRFPLVTDNISIVLDNITVSGEFDANYTAPVYVGLNIVPKITNIDRNRHRKSFILESKEGRIYITSCKFMIDEFDIVDEIIMKIYAMDLDFNDFIINTEMTLIPLIGGQHADPSLIDARGMITVTVYSDQIENQIRSGKSMIHSSGGLALNIEEDLEAGNTIRIIFQLRVYTRGPGYHLKMIPIRFIKY